MFVRLKTVLATSIIASLKTAPPVKAFLFFIKKMCSSKRCVGCVLGFFHRPHEIVCCLSKAAVHSQALMHWQVDSSLRSFRDRFCSVSLCCVALILQLSSHKWDENIFLWMMGKRTLSLNHCGNSTSFLSWFLGLNDKSSLLRCVWKEVCWLRTNIHWLQTRQLQYSLYAFF